MLAEDDQSAPCGAVHRQRGCSRNFPQSWSANEDSDRLMDVIFDIEAGFDLPVWTERVPVKVTLVMFCQERLSLP